MKIIVTHPTGNANVRAAIRGFLHDDFLAEFHTSIASFPGTILDRLGSVTFLSEIHRRRYESSLKEKTKTWPWLELARMLASKAKLSSFTKHEAGLFCVDKVYQNLDKHVAKKLFKAAEKGIDSVYSYEDGALQTLKKAKELGLHGFYDLPIGYWRTANRLLETEKDRWPEWVSTLTGFKNSRAKLARKDEELRLADGIFVASRFTAETLKDYPGPLSPINVIPYGFPQVATTRQYDSNIKRRRLKLLFVGGLSQRKGIADLFAAVDALGDHIQLTVIGHKAASHCRPLEAALNKHKWIPSLPHQEVLRQMQSHDVLLFPSLFEGFGLVITEAMSQGTPVITTDRTAGPDLIRDGGNGWLIEAGSTIAIRNALEILLSRPQDIAEVGIAAMKTAAERPWSEYGQELAKAVKDIATSQV
jgi:glycosyltransferase involved in cell wall biosynthesis